jgi:hypothetical protein
MRYDKRYEEEDPCEFPRRPLLVDFSHLRAKGVGYARHQSPLKEVIEVRTLPTRMIRVLAPFAPLFSKRVWQHAQLLLMGAILAPGRRTVGSQPCARSGWTSRSASIATIATIGS